MDNSYYDGLVILHVPIPWGYTACADLYLSKEVNIQL